MPCRESYVSFINSDFENTFAADLADLGAWFVHVLTVVWGS